MGIAMSNLQPAIVVDNITVSLGDRGILRNVSLQCATGSITCVIGANGSGKSTLLRAIAGDLELSSGSIEVTSRLLSTLSAPERAALRGVLRPATQPLFPYTVREVISWGGFHRGQSASLPDDVMDALKLGDVMDALKLGDILDQKATTLSSGQLAKVNLAQVLVQNPEVILADEPEAALDPVARQQTWELLQQSGKTIVIATHSIDLVRQFADRVVGISNGSIAFDVSKAELTDELITSLY